MLSLSLQVKNNILATCYCTLTITCGNFVSLWT